MTTSNNVGQLGDTTLTKVFIGGLAWETPKEAMRDHFQKYGEILEAVIISDKVTGRSKGYGFVTFKDAESAKKACEDITPVINGRRANCNLASLGPRRPRLPPPTMPPSPLLPLQGIQYTSNVAARSPASQGQWYYPIGTSPAPLRHQTVVPFYGYSPTYITSDMSYNHKLSYNGGSYMNGQFSQVYPGQPMVGVNPLMPMYPFYHFHQSQTMGLPAPIYFPTAASSIPTVPNLISKPTPMTPSTVCLQAVE